MLWILSKCIEFHVNFAPPTHHSCPLTAKTIEDHNVIIDKTLRRNFFVIHRDARTSIFTRIARPPIDIVEDMCMLFAYKKVGFVP